MSPGVAELHARLTWTDVFLPPICACMDSVALGYALTWIMSQRILIHLRGTPLSSLMT